MGYTVEQAKLILEELKYSWFLRVYVALWSICALAGFIFLIVLGKHASLVNHEGSFRNYFVNATSIPVPGFRFRTTFGSETNFFATAPQCNFGSPTAVGPAVPMQPCYTTEQAGQESCYEFDHPQTTTTQTNSLFFTRAWSRIDCTYNMSISTDATDVMMAFELINPDAYEFGGNIAESIWFLPEPLNPWIVIDADIFDPDVYLWERTLTYNGLNPSSAANVGLTGSEVPYSPSIVLNTFYMQHFAYEGNWAKINSLGEIGGAVFFLYILHTFLMILIGGVLENDSTFLGGSSSGSTSYDTIPDNNL